MPHRPLIIVKLGGSVVTEKHRQQPRVRQELVCRIGRVLKKHYNPTKQRLILIHGAGSFGHLSAKRYGLAEGTRGHPGKLPRALENKASDQLLNSILTRLFLNTGLPAAGFNTSSLVTNRSGKLSHFDLMPIRTALKTGAVPLLHGDMVFDEEWGMSICSGDALAPYLAQELGAAKIFYASDVEGVFTRDPYRFPDAKIIRRVSLNELLSDDIELGHSHHVDVTAGFKGKFSVYRGKIFPTLQMIGVLNGLKPKNFLGIFSQKNFSGTLIQVKKRGGK